MNPMNWSGYIRYPAYRSTPHNVIKRGFKTLAITCSVIIGTGLAAVFRAYAKDFILGEYPEMTRSSAVCGGVEL
jgi:hypothetical protein